MFFKSFYVLIYGIIYSKLYKKRREKLKKKQANKTKQNPNKQKTKLGSINFYTLSCVTHTFSTNLNDFQMR